MEEGCHDGMVYPPEIKSSSLTLYFPCNWYVISKYLRYIQVITIPVDVLMTNFISTRG